MPGCGCFSSTKMAPCLKVSKQQQPAALTSQSFPPQQAKEEGPRTTQIRGHTCLPCDKQVCDFSQLRIQSLSWAEPHQHVECGMLPHRPPPRGPRPSSRSHPSLDARAEIRHFPPCGKWSSRQAGLVCSPEGPYNTHSQRQFLFTSTPTPDPLRGASPLWVCLAPQPSRGLTPGGSSARPGRCTLSTSVCFS